MRLESTSRHFLGLLNTSYKRAGPRSVTRLSQIRASTVRPQHTASQESNLPRIAQPSTWNSIIPRALRTKSQKSSKPLSKKPSNPATYFIWIYLLIGSQAIRIITIQNDFTTFMRRADLKLAKLKEVVEKLQRGEDVDVEKVLGTGDEAQEQEWEEALKEIENEERIWQTSKDRRRMEKERLAKDQEDANPVNNGTDKATSEPQNSILTETPTPEAPGFY